MTPKEKAEELATKFILRLPIICGVHHAKKCALVAVDEICEILEDNGFTFTEYHDRTTIEYWLQVKQEIEKL